MTIEPYYSQPTRSHLKSVQVKVIVQNPQVTQLIDKN